MVGSHHNVRNGFKGLQHREGLRTAALECDRSEQATLKLEVQVEGAWMGRLMNVSACMNHISSFPQASLMLRQTGHLDDHL